MTLDRDLGEVPGDEPRQKLTVSARRVASRRNGARSRGPKTEEGKAISARNAVGDGILTKCVLMSDETLDERRSELECWLKTFKPATPGEALIVTQIVDALVRRERLARFKTRVREASVEEALKKTEFAKKIAALDEGVQAIRGLADTVGSLVSDVSIEAVQQMAPALRRTLELVERTDTPLTLLVPLRDALNALGIDSGIGQALAPVVQDRAVDGPVPAATFRELAVAAEDVETWLLIARNVARAGLEEERRRLAEDPTVVDEAQLQKLDRHRARIGRELDELLHLMKQVRELAQPGKPDSDSFCQVELRPVARPDLAQR